MKLLAPALLAFTLVPVESALSAQSPQSSQPSQTLTSEEALGATPVARSGSAAPAAPLSTPAPQAEKTQTAPAPNDLREIMKRVQTLYIKPKPGGAWSGFPSEPLEKKLLENKDFQAMGLALVKDSRADLLIVLDRPTMSWDCTYRMTHEESGMVVGAGKAIAWDCIRAAPDIAGQIVKRLKQLREVNPVTPQPPASSSIEKARSWKVRYSGPTTLLPKDTLITLTMNGQWITVRDSKAFSLSIPAANVRTADSRTEVRKATKGWEDFWDGCCAGGGGLLLFIAPVFLAGEGILGPIKTSDHFVSMYWMENGSMRGMEFRASSEDTKSLLSELDKASGRNAEAGAHS